MENINTPPPITPVPEPSTPPSLNISSTPPLHSARKFKIIFIVFFIIFFLTIGTAAAVYTFKEVSRNNSNESQQIPSISPQPSAIFEVSPIPTSSSAKDECVVSGCSGQFCMEKSEAEGFVSTCEYTPSYACYKTAECKTQIDGKCGWTKTTELTSCLETAK